MSSRKFAFSLAVLALLLVPELASAGGPATKGFRIHRQHTLADGSVVAFTDLSSNLGRDSQSGTFQEDKTILLDAARFGRWIIKIHVKGSGRDATEEEYCELTYLATGERLRLNRVAQGTPQEPAYCVTFGDTSVTAGPQSGPNSSRAFIPAVQDNASKGFRAGLSFLWSLSLTTESFDWLMPTFSVIWGLPPAQGAVPSVPYELVPVDCSFDASFGYPCDPQERPARADGRIYVKAMR